MKVKDMVGVVVVVVADSYTLAVVVGLAVMLGMLGKCWRSYMCGCSAGSIYVAEHIKEGW